MPKEAITAFKNVASFCIWNNAGLISEGQQRLNESLYAGVMP